MFGLNAVHVLSHLDVDPGDLRRCRVYVAFDPPQAQLEADLFAQAVTFEGSVNNRLEGPRTSNRAEILTWRGAGRYSEHPGQAFVSYGFSVYRHLYLKNSATIRCILMFRLIPTAFPALS